MSLGTFGIDLLALGAHPDDVEICCGGLLLQLARSGYKTGIIDLTEGELGSSGDVPTRRKEAEAAAEILKLHTRRNLALPDGWVTPWFGAEASESVRAESQLTKVVKLLRELRPEVVVIPHTHGRHPDHGAAALLLRKAIFLAGVKRFPAGAEDTPWKPRQVLHYQMRFAFRPSFVTDITDVIEEKVKAIQCYSSQVDRSKSTAATTINSPLSLSSLRHRDGYYGAMIGTAYGEPFFIQNALPVPDPVSLFRESTGEALLFPEDPS